MLTCMYIIFHEVLCCIFTNNTPSALNVFVVKSSCFFVVTLLHKQWRPGKGWNTSLNMQPRVFTLDPESTVFSSHFDMVQEQLETLVSMDDLLSGKKT